MKGVLLKYNKVHNDSLRNLAPRLAKDFDIHWGDLSIFGDRTDLLSYESIKSYIEQFGKLNFIVIGDVFWQTGQSICRYGVEHGVPVYFIQHGQWIYTKNKKQLGYYPSCTCLFGNNVTKMCKKWEYGQHSHIVATGSPRYDGAIPNGGSYIYFSPPVIEEIIHGEPSGRIRRPFLTNLEAIRKIDKGLSMIIQPHYRESRTDILHELFPFAQFADPQFDALKLIRGANKVLTCRNSTVVLDAIAHHKLVVLMDLPQYDSCFFDRGYFGQFALESSDKSELLNNLTSEIKVKRSEYVNNSQDYIYLGDASSRIAELIKKGV